MDDDIAIFRQPAPNVCINKIGNFLVDLGSPLLRYSGGFDQAVLGPRKALDTLYKKFAKNFLD